MVVDWLHCRKTATTQLYFNYWNVGATLYLYLFLNPFFFVVVFKPHLCDFFLLLANALGFSTFTTVPALL